jgi:hypothetical protein
MEHTKRSHYATKFMEGTPNSTSKPYAEVLMGGRRQHHAEGESVMAPNSLMGMQQPHPESMAMALPRETRQMKKGGSMRCRYAEGGNVMEKRHGGSTRKHRDMGGSTPADQLSEGKAVGQVLKRGGSARKHRDMGGSMEEPMPIKRAMGGAGKFRKGMMGRK